MSQPVDREDRLEPGVCRDLELSNRLVMSCIEVSYKLALMDICDIRLALECRSARKRLRKRPNQHNQLRNPLRLHIVPGSTTSGRPAFEDLQLNCHKSSS